jgi:hypothetical protein
MADRLAAVEAQEEDEIFVYMGGDQHVPVRVRRARIHKSVKIVRARAFQNRINLVSVEFHDGIEIIEEDAFNECISLSGSIKMLGIRIIKGGAFYNCCELTGVEFGDKLEKIEEEAFSYCRSLRSITMPSVRTIGRWAFYSCCQLTDLELPKGLETIEDKAFHTCTRLRRIVMPLKDDMIGVNVFSYVPELATVDLVRGVHSTVASLHMESWRNEIKDEINRVNEDLPNFLPYKTIEIRQWMESVTFRLEHYKAEHHDLLKEATTLLELALWKANLDDNGGEGGVLEREGVRTTRRQLKRARKEICVTSGSSIVIKNVLPFLT